MPSRISILLAAVAAATVVSCGGSEHDDAESAESRTSALAGQPISCAINLPPPFGFPQKLCYGGQIKPTFVAPHCYCYPADANTTDEMSYQLVTVLHAPPGNMSSISYAKGATLGSVEQITKTNQMGFDVELNVSVPGSSADAEGKYTWGQVSGTQNLVQTINTNTVGIVQSQDIPNHKFDVFVLWLNPEFKAHINGITGQVTSTIGPSSSMWSATGQSVSSIGPDGNPQRQVVAVTGNALANPAARTPAETGFLAHITPTQISQILALDEFYGNDSYDPSADQAHYRYVTTLDLAGPEPGSPITVNTGSTVEYDSQNDAIDGTASHKEVTVKTGPKFGDDNIISFSVQAGPTWTWDYNDTRTDIQGTQKAATVVLQSSTPCLHASVDMYLDLAFGSYVAVPSFTNYSCDTNLALGQFSWQSTDLNGSVASRANDGNTDGNWWDGSVSHTDYGFVNSGEADWPGQYWAVDLGSERVVNAVNIFNRTDCCSWRLSHYNVLAYDMNQNEWKVISNHAADNTAGVSFFQWPVNMVRTRYVMIAKTDEDHLQLAEVQVMGF